MTTPQVPPIFASKIVDHSLEQIPVEVIKDNPILALYFSGNWCPPCKSFTPKLIDFYKTANEVGKKIEIIYVSGDESFEKFKEYFGIMPWVAVDFDDPGREALIEHYGVLTIPALLIIDKEGKLKTKDGRPDVTSKGLDALKGW